MVAYWSVGFGRAIGEGSDREEGASVVSWEYEPDSDETDSALRLGGDLERMARRLASLFMVDRGLCQWLGGISRCRWRVKDVLMRRFISQDL